MQGRRPLRYPRSTTRNRQRRSWEGFSWCRTSTSLFNTICHLKNRTSKTPRAVKSYLKKRHSFRRYYITLRLTRSCLCRNTYSLWLSRNPTFPTENLHFSYLTSFRFLSWFYFEPLSKNQRRIWIKDTLDLIFSVEYEVLSLPALFQCRHIMIRRKSYNRRCNCLLLRYQGRMKSYLLWGYPKQYEQSDNPSAQSEVWDG